MNRLSIFFFLFGCLNHCNIFEDISPDLNLFNKKFDFLRLIMQSRLYERTRKILLYKVDLKYVTKSNQKNVKNFQKSYI